MILKITPNDYLTTLLLTYLHACRLKSFFALPIFIYLVKYVASLVSCWHLWRQKQSENDDHKNLIRTSSDITLVKNVGLEVQGVRMQTVTSNLDQTERKNAINFNLKVDSDQGRLGIYPWMIIMIISWPLLASVTFSLTSPIFHISGLPIKYLI